MIETSLYSISSAISEILSSEEWDDAAVEQLEDLNLALEVKAGNILHFMANLTAFTVAAKEEEQRLAARRKAAENRITALKGYILAAMQSADRTELEAGTHKLTIQNNPPACIVDEERLIPARFWTVVPESYQLDKKSLAAELKISPVEGAHLEQGKSLRIK